MAKFETSNSDRTISLRLQCVIKKHNINACKVHQFAINPNASHQRRTQLKVPVIGVQAEEVEL